MDKNVANSEKPGEISGDDTFQIACFSVDDLLCGVDINWVQEISQNLAVTRVPLVPLVPDYVIGIMNLRGRIVSVINLGKKLGLSPCQLGIQSRVIIVNWEDEYIGLLVERIKEVVTLAKQDIAPPPSNLEGNKARYFTGAYRHRDELISILDVKAVLTGD